MLVKGKIVKGQGLATPLFGVPTANLQLAEICPLEPGTYAAKACLNDNWLMSLAYISPQDPKIIEVHIFDFKGDLLNTELSVELLSLISRPVFWKDQLQMRAKIFADLRKTRDYFGLD